MNNQSRIFRGSPRYYEEIEEREFGNQALDFLSINMPPVCNYRCEFCLSGLSQEREFHHSMSAAESIELIRQAAQLGVRHIEISGEGEPLVFRNRILEILTAAESNGVHTTVFTNGSLLTPTVSRQLAQHDVSIAVSLETCDAENYESFVKRTRSFHTVMENIEHAKEAFHQHIRMEGRNMILPLAIHTIVMPQNIDQIAQIRQIAGREMFLSLAPFIPQGDGLIQLATAPTVVEPGVVDQLIERYGDGSLILSQSRANETGGPTCGTFRFGLGMRHDGEVLFDAHAYDTAGIIGNIRNNPLHELVTRLTEAKTAYFRDFHDGGFCPLRNQQYRGFVRALEHNFRPSV